MPADSRPWSLLLLRTGLWLAVLLPAPAVRAEVFLRMGRGEPALAQLGGVEVYQSDMRINGRRGRLAVYGFDCAPAQILPDLRQALLLPELKMGGASLMTTRQEGGRETTVLLLPGANTENCLLLLMTQTEKPDRRPPPTEWPGRIAYPDARLFFTAELEQTRTRLAVATTQDAPMEAATRMEAILTRTGWARMPPDKIIPGLMLFSQGNRICAFSALASDAPGRPTKITILQRDGATP
jgi:hypothetical protein